MVNTKVNKNEIVVSTDNNYDPVKNKIFMVRSVQVILDRDLAALYDIETRALKQAVNRNRKRFPNDFMFILTEIEVDFMVSQNVIPSKQHLGGSFPYAFTEQGVANVSSILNNDKAIETNIQIMRAFVAMRKFISNNYELFLRLDNVERKQIEQKIEIDNKFEKVFRIIEDKSIKPNKGIFFDGQVFDAYKFVSDLIRSAKNSIILVDNYIDDSVLTLFSKRNKDVTVKIFTNITKQLELDLKKYNSQYPLITIEKFTKSHDRFLIIDNQMYHFGASLKDLGKKWFAFSQFDKEAIQLLNNLNNEKR
jgi:hypothetical protein